MQYPERLSIAVLSACLVCAPACHKEPDPPAATTTTTERAEPPAPTNEGRSSAPADPGRCIVPLPESPPPRAEPAATCPADPKAPLTLRKGWVTFEGAPRAPRVEVEIADTPPARERGLMYRTAMGENQGMIFSWPTEAPRAFWMRDTCIPLDMLFIAEDGTIAGILEQVPVLNEAPRSIPCPVAHVLEVAAGWTRAHGVAPGQKIRIES